MSCRYGDEPRSAACFVSSQNSRLKKGEKYMAKKNVKELKVCAQSEYHYKDVPQIQLKGAWLHEFGFTEIRR